MNVGEKIKAYVLKVRDIKIIEIISWHLMCCMSSINTVYKKKFQSIELKTGSWRCLDIFNTTNLI